MADITALKNRIRAAIKANDNQEITGPVLQQTLLDIVDEFSSGRNIDGYTFIGVATPTTVPPSDLTEYSRVCYLASQNGVYTNLGNTEVSNEIAIIKYNGLSWIAEQVIDIDDEPTTGSDNPAKSSGILAAIRKSANILTARIYDKNGVPRDFADITYDNGIYINFNGGRGYNALYGITKLLYIKGQTKIIISAKNNAVSVVPLCLFYDENKNLIQTVAAEQEITVKRSVSVPQNAVYVLCQTACYQYNDFVVSCEDNPIEIPVEAINAEALARRNADTQLQLTLTSSITDKNGNTLPLSEITDANGFYMTASGSMGYNASYCMTPLISLDDIDEFNYIGHIRNIHISFVPAVLYFNEQKEYIGYELIGQDIANDNPQNLHITTIPSGTKYAKFQTFNDAKDFRITIKTSGMDFRIRRVEQQLQNTGNEYEDKKIKTIENGVIRQVKETAGFCSIFHKWGIIGDSLSSGLFQWIESDREPQFTDYTYSWGQRLMAMIGQAIGTNWSVGGLTAKSWFARYVTNRVDGFNINGTWTKFDEDLKQAYTIMLGTNDNNAGVAVGNFTTDVNLSDYTQNADTFCGNYAKIIQKTKELQPSAKIFVITIPAIFSATAEQNGYNAIIRQMATEFTNVFLIDLYTLIPNISSSLADLFRIDGHGTSTGYQWIAYIIATIIDNVIENNLDAFKWVCRIGTQYDDGNL